jgi:Flp pilus assembly protein TadG
MSRPLPTPPVKSAKRGQSFVELALAMPVLLVMVVGMLEVVFSYNDYMQMLDGVRNGARSQADVPTIPSSAALEYYDSAPCASTVYFFRVTACNTATFLLPIDINREGYGTLSAVASPPCIDKDTEPALYTNDIVLTVFTTSQVNVDPDGGGPLTAPSVQIDRFDNNNYNSVTSKGNLVTDSDESGWSYIRDQYKINNPASTSTARGMCSEVTKAQIKSMIVGGTNGSLAAPNTAYLLVEVFFKHYQIFNAPFFSDFIANPFHLYTYAIFSTAPSEATSTP